MEPSPAEIRKLYVEMVRSRTFEETAIAAAADGKIPGSWMSGIGQEGALGAIVHLRPDDYLTYTHRGAYCFLGRGCDPGKIFAELFGKKTGYCRGKGGRHLADLEHGIFGKSGSIGGHAPIAVGLATALQLRGRDQIVMSFFGEGTSNRGTMHESMNMAAVQQLPLVWICENNGYAGSTPAATILAAGNVAAMAAAYGMIGATVDGNDVLAVFDSVGRACLRARTGEGPSLVELETYRVRPFAEGGIDPRDPREVEAWKKRDPLERLERHALQQGILTAPEVRSLRDDARGEMDEARAFAESSPFPEPHEAFEDLYS